MDGTSPFWRPGRFHFQGLPGGLMTLTDGHLAATVCRRGHVAQGTLNHDPGDDLGYCHLCGARIIGRCEQCGLRIRGQHTSAGGQLHPNYRPPAFCDGCGAVHPWATREQRIYELENLLDEEDIEEADRLIVLDHLERLRRQPDLDEKEQGRLWSAIKQKAPGLVAASGQRIIESLATAAIKAQLGL
jgi:hypothetical protein